MSALLVVLSIILIANVYLLLRNERVYQARAAMLGRVSEAARYDIDAGREWEWRYEELEATSYFRQLMSVGPICWPRDPARTER